MTNFNKEYSYDDFYVKLYILFKIIHLMFITHSFTFYLRNFVLYIKLSFRSTLQLE